MWYLSKPTDQKSRNVNDENNTRYFKLPFIGQYSRIPELKLPQLLKRFCETDLNIKLVFTSFIVLLMLLNPWWFINLLVRDIIPVTLVNPVAIFLPGLKNIQ